MSYDLVIRGGTIVDGTGLSSRVGDIGVRSGRIIDIGHLEESALGALVVDADGLIVAPGIVDVHTHYDPQVTFEPYATASCYHGVTTVLAGNCGFSIAPTHPKDRDYIARMFSRVEGMAPEAMYGVDWAFESFPEFLASRSGRLGVNFACYVGHSAVRRWIMGEAASERAASSDEIRAMSAVVREAVHSGAAGFTSSNVPTQFDGDERPVPSRFADVGELVALAEAAGQSSNGVGSIGFVPYGAMGGYGPDDEELLITLGLSSRLNIIVQGLGGKSKVEAPTGDWEHVQAFLERAASRGVGIYNMLPVRPFDRPFSFLHGTSDLYLSVPSWQSLMSLPVAERIEALRDSSRRDVMRGAVENYNRDPSKGTTIAPPLWTDVVVDFAESTSNARYAGQTIAHIADIEGRAPADVLLDLVLSDSLKTGLRWTKDSKEFREIVSKCLRDPRMIVGVSDGGAHLDRDDGSDWSSYFLRTWVHEEGFLSLEEGIQQMTQVPAAIAGLNTRGTILPGRWADIWVFDIDKIGPGTKEKVADFPGGNARWSTRPEGIYATIINGQPIVQNGELTGLLPGHVVAPQQP